MKKSDVEFHSDRGPGHPAVNIKCRTFISVSKVQARFKCCEETAEKALRFAFDSAVEQFWEVAPEHAQTILGAHVKVYGEGRSGGWLVAHNLAPFDSWDAIALGRWAHFARVIEREVKWLSSEEYVFDMISANDWAPADGLLDDEEAETEEAHDAACRDIATV